MKRFISLILIISIVTVCAAWTWGTVYDTFESPIAPDASYVKHYGENQAGNQVVHAVTFNPKNSMTRLRAGKSYGKVYGVQTLSSIAAGTDASFPGQVVAAINGDFFDLGIGVPFGVFVDDGKILSSPINYWSAFALRKDGSAFITKHGTILDVVLHIGGVNTAMTALNDRHRSADSLIIYTDDYGASTHSKKDTYEVICRVDSGSPRHGETMKLTVLLPSEAGNVPIYEKQAVLSARGTKKSVISSLKAGDTISVTCGFNSQWADVSFAIGGNNLLVQNGDILAQSEYTKNPRTCVGIKEDGEVVLAVVDGRQAGYSEGLSYYQAAVLMRDMGCVDVLNLDGGGSTTMVVRQLGSSQLKLVNNPSGGVQRQVANALVLLNTAQKGAAARLVVNEYGRKVLVGGSYKFTVSAIDENQQPVTHSGAPVFTNAPNGVFTPRETGFIPIEVHDGELFGSVICEVVDNITDITLSHSSLSLSPSSSVTLTATCKRGKQSIESTAGAYTWYAPPELGSFSSPGVFVAASEHAKGEITVSAGSITKKIPVAINPPPVVVSELEGEPRLVGVGYKIPVAPAWKYSDDRDYVMFGEKSLKLYYDFTSASADSKAYIIGIGNISFTDLPDRIGMWIYGDASGVLMDTIVYDANGKRGVCTFTDSDGIDWTGWRHASAEVPQDLVPPLTVKIPVSLSPGKNRTHGSLYFDRIRAIYGETPSTEDRNAPTLTKAWPSSNQIITTAKPEIGLIVGDVGSGINPASVELFVNDYLCDASYSNGKITYQVKNALKSGYHTIKLRVRDNFGNPLVKKWQFEVRV